MFSITNYDEMMGKCNENCTGANLFPVSRRISRIYLPGRAVNCVSCASGNIKLNIRGNNKTSKKQFNTEKTSSFRLNSHKNKTTLSCQRRQNKKQQQN